MTCEKLTLLVTWITLSQVLPAEAEGVFPSFKGWWGHRIDDDVFAGGRLTPRMIKYADEAGYKSIITLLAFGDNVPLGDEQFVSTDEEEQIATTMTDLKFYRVHTVEETTNRTWRSIDSVQRFGPIFDSAERPVFVHCSCSWTAAMFIHLHYLNTSKIDNVADMFQSLIEKGYDPHTDDDFVLNVANTIGKEALTNEDIPAYPSTLTTSEWCSNYWLLHPVHGNVFISGQIQNNHIPLIEKAGVNDVINLRRASGEEVTLLNVEDQTGEERQKTVNLESHRIDPSKPTTYISSNATLNYDSRNPLEWGDEIGYNGTLQELDFESSTLNYHHAPIDSSTSFDVEIWKKYMKEWPGKDSNILFHDCRGNRAAMASLLYVGTKYDKDEKWLLNKGKEVGYDFDNAEFKALLKAILKDDVSGSSTLQTTTIIALGLMNLLCFVLGR